MRILIASGFFESNLKSYREYSYSKELAKLGHEVTLMCGDQSQIWKWSRTRLQPTDPTSGDSEFVSKYGVRLLRRKVRLRYSDFVLYWPSLAAIRAADVVHVIEFRQGVTLLVALFARLLGKPVVYDHEQRGDRRARWFSQVDSLFRRTLIFMGSWCVDCVRHTVLANKEHFDSCTPRKVRTMFAPLGTDTGSFFFDPPARAEVRAELGVAPEQRMAVMSGKLHGQKRVAEVALACRRAGIQLALIGPMTPDVRDSLQELGSGREIILPPGDVDRLRAVYCSADLAIFTTFSVSYWEAYATGVNLIVPRSAFSEAVFAGDPNVVLFGDAAMFTVTDEEYRPDFSIVESLVAAMSSMEPQPRITRSRYSAKTQVAALAEIYQSLLLSRADVSVK